MVRLSNQSNTIILVILCITIAFQLYYYLQSLTKSQEVLNYIPNDIKQLIQDESIYNKYIRSESNVSTVKMIQSNNKNTVNNKNEKKHNLETKMQLTEEIKSLHQTIKENLRHFSDEASNKNEIRWDKTTITELSIMFKLNKFIQYIISNQQNAITIQSDKFNLFSGFQENYQCTAYQQMLQYNISKTISMDICSEIEWYKLAQLVVPDIKNIFDIGGNKGYLGSLFASLWTTKSDLSDNTYISPIKIYECAMKYNLWKDSKNPGGYCKDGYNYGIPFRSTRREINQPLIYSFDGSKYLSNTLTNIISNQTYNCNFHPSVNHIWKYKNYAISDSIGKIGFTMQNQTSNAGFEGGRIRPLTSTSYIEEVDMTTVDTLVDQLIKRKDKNDGLHLLKIDTEGNDNKVLTGAMTALNSTIKMFTFEGGSGITFSKDFNEYLDKQLGYSCYSTSRAGLFKWNGNCMVDNYFGSFKNKDKGNIFCVNRRRVPLLAIIYDLLSFPLMIQLDILSDVSNPNELSINLLNEKMDKFQFSSSYLQYKSFCQPWPKCLTN